MPSLVTQQELRKAQKLQFCYLCGKWFAPGDRPNRDHLPPTALFLKEDRNCPLILPTHEHCNTAEKDSDELLCILFDMIHGRPAKPGQRVMQVFVAEDEGGKRSYCKGLDMQRFLRRCVRGFHAVLYGEWLPVDTAHAFHPPFRGAQFDGRTGKPTNAFNASLNRDALLGQHGRFAAVLKMNRLARSTDKVVCRNGKCVYECVWSHSDDGQPLCLWGLQIYEWNRAGDVLGFLPRGCIGMYRPSRGAPVGGSQATELAFPFPNWEPLDPFGN